MTNSYDLQKIKDNDIFVAQQTFPAFIMGMRKAKAFVTDEGGILCHAAIVSRELGIPAIVGCKNATAKIKTGDPVTVDCSGEEGIVFQGELKFKVAEKNVKNLPETKTHIMMNIATPETAFEKS